jgi:hypothetical protein
MIGLLQDWRGKLAVGTEEVEKLIDGVNQFLHLSLSPDKIISLLYSDFVLSGLNCVKIEDAVVAAVVSPMLCHLELEPALHA